MVDAACKNHIFRQPSLYHTHTISQRNNPDCVVNKTGKELVHLCRSLGLYMLNGRTRGDSLGRFTYCSTLGTSVVDYAITDMDPSSISAFTVRPQTPLTDHCQINVYLKTNGQQNNKQPEPCKMFELQTYKWAPDSDDTFKNILTSPKITNLIHDFLSAKFQTNQSEINRAVTEILNIFHKSANKAGLTKKSYKTKQKPKGDEWFDEDCKNIRKNLRNLSKSKTPSTSKHRPASELCRNTERIQTNSKAKKRKTLQSKAKRNRRLN